MGELTTRAATAGDVAAITAIYAEQVLYGSATFEIVPPDEAEMGRRLAEVLAGGYPYFVAERDRRVLGYAYAGPYRARPAYRNTVEDSVYIASDSRGLGLGGRLLGQLIHAAAAAGFRQMVALIGDSKNAASIRLHKAAGFADVGTMRSVGYKHGRWLDVVLMQRALGPGDASPPDR
ncbi:MAG TPA: GNAT family N-acetyltransferase [Bauldia sp.]|nr:GNAT family N-acetyltransferase [Bauldia sp.]